MACTCLVSDVGRFRDTDDRAHRLDGRAACIKGTILCRARCVTGFGAVTRSAQSVCLSSWAAENVGMSAEEFRNHNDDDYLRWVADHHRGFVLNIQRTCNPRDARLYLAYCETITGFRRAGILSRVTGSRSIPNRCRSSIAGP
jgi:hypothetical protein